MVATRRHSASSSPAWASADLIQFASGKAETVVRACHDATTLYVAFECRELPGRQTQATPRDRDGDVWSDDSVEICLAPPEAIKERRWFHFILNVAGYPNRIGDS